MDTKKIIVMVIEMIIASTIFLTAISFLVNEDDDGRFLIFNLAGSTATADDFNEADTGTHDLLTDIKSTDNPVIRYCKGTCEINIIYEIKSLIEVKVAGSTDYVNGKDGTEFSIFIYEVKDNEGNIIEPGSTDPDVKVVYDKDSETVLFKEKGVYTINMKIIGSKGRTTLVDIKVPVEE